MACFRLMAYAKAGIDWFKTATSKFEDVDKYHNKIRLTEGRKDK